MQHLVYPRERTLATMTLVLGVLAWLAIILGTYGLALIGLTLGFLAYLFMQSALMAHIKGNGVELSEAQFPDLYAQFVECCDKLKLEQRPQAYILNGNGALNAFATQFLKTEFVVLMSDVVDAMDKHADGVRFYIGHELGHLRQKHLRLHFFRLPALCLPLLGAAYARARETTCDRHGLVCSSSPENAARALAALSAGSQRWQQLDVGKFVRQSKHSIGFWMSFHELTAPYPWLTKRAARILHPTAAMPPRNTFAYVVAAFIPYAGRLGGGFGFLILLYLLATMASIVIPVYQDYTVKAKLTAVMFESTSARESLGGYYLTHVKVPDSLQAAGVPPTLSNGTTLTLDAAQMVLTVSTKSGDLVFTPTVDNQGRVTWRCAGSQGIKATALPGACK